MCSYPSKAYLEPTHVFSTPSAKTSSYLSLANTYLLPVYARPDFVLERGKGSWVWDSEGRKFLDFSAGIAVNALGHADEGVAKVCIYGFFSLFSYSVSFFHELLSCSVSTAVHIRPETYVVLLTGPLVYLGKTDGR